LEVVAGQFPWIYLIYLAILVSPILYATLRSKRRNRRFDLTHNLSRSL